MSFLDKHNFFHQFGFCSNMSTIDFLTKSSNFIHSNLDKKLKILGIFLDLKKDFDCVNHTLLNRKLVYNGIRDNALNLIKLF
jgi:hypothetical protein